MARRGTQQPARPAPARKAGPTTADKADKDRAARALDVAARRVPVWQVSAVTVLSRIYDARPAGSDELAMYQAIDRVLKQVPEAVLHASRLHRRGKWTPL